MSCRVSSRPAVVVRRHFRDAKQMRWFTAERSGRGRIALRERHTAKSARGSVAHIIEATRHIAALVGQRDLLITRPICRGVRAATAEHRTKRVGEILPKKREQRLAVG